jgi:hypothetical protein
MIGSYIITMVICLLVANIFVFETLETRYINSRKDVLLAHSKNVIDSAIEKDTGSAARLRKAVEMASI